MAKSHLQNPFVGAMIDGQSALYTWHFYVSHDICVFKAQLLLILCFLCFAQLVHGSPGCKLPVVFSGGFQQSVLFSCVQGLNLFNVGGDGPGLVQGIPVVADGRIQQQRQPCKQYYYQYYCGQIFSHTAVLSLPLHTGEGLALPVQQSVSVLFSPQAA